MVMRAYSAGVRPSSRRISAPASCSAFSSSAEIEGVCMACSTSSPKVLEGRFTPSKRV